MLARIFRTPGEPAQILEEDRPSEDPAPPTAAAPDRLAGRLAAAADEHGPDGAGLRPALLAVLQGHLEAGREAIKTEFLAGRISGSVCTRAQSDLADSLIRPLADLAAERLHPVAKPGAQDRFAIVSVGGYGRRELAPQSDIDLLFLLPAKRSERVIQAVETLLYILWDLQLKVGHAVRTVDECVKSAKGDMTIATNLLEARHLWGEAALSEELKRRYHKEVVRGASHAFVENKLAERDGRHRKLGDSRYVLEPNIKEGKGGLRDLQTLFWIGRFLYQIDDIAELADKGVLTRPEARRFAKAHGQLWSLRCHLHYLTGRAEERLTFDVQKAMADRLGFTDREGALGVERFMKFYFLIAKSVGDLTRVVCAALEAEARRKPRRPLRWIGRGPRLLEGFRLEGERVTVAAQDQFEKRPVDMIRLFRVAQRYDLDIHPAALKLIARSLGQVRTLRADPDANRTFLEILTARQDPEHALRWMSGSGVLGRFIHDFGRVVAQMQYDMYHVYTVDEHTLIALGILHRIESGELTEEMRLASELFPLIESRRALYVALFLHDIAKGRGGDHSELGARAARRLGPRLGLDDQETETVEWLVRNHLMMSHTAFRRDIEDPQTVRTFVEKVESPERLRLLLLLTCADIRAVGPGRWNGWRASLLANLYYRAEELMSGGFGAQNWEARVKAARDRVREALADWPEADVDSFVGRGYPGYWLSLDTETQARHAALVREADQSDEPLVVDTRVDTASATTEVTVVTEDHPGLFSQLSGALAAGGANIVEAKIFTLTDGLALDIFTVQDAATGEAIDSGDKLARISATIERSLWGDVQPLRELASKRAAYPTRARSMRVQPRVLVENEVSRTHTVIEVNARDRPGLLYDVTRTLTYLGLQISSAKIATYGLRAVDVFYVKDIFGLKITHAAKLHEIRRRLTDVLADPDCVPTDKPVRLASGR
jgi:[protein-PII] uridylyltransferase